VFLRAVDWRGRQARTAARRLNPAFVARLALGTVLVVVCAVLATTEPGIVEDNVFRLLNQLPTSAGPPLTGVMQLGSLGAVPVFALLAVLGHRPRLGRDLLIGGAGAWAVAKVVQTFVHHQPPDLVLSHVVTRAADGPGIFPSSHVAIAAALATVAGPYLTRPMRRLAWMVVLLVGIARMYVGAHFPLDVAGGAALGWAVGGAVDMLARPRAAPLAGRLREALAAAGHPVLPPEGLRNGHGHASFRAQTDDGMSVHVAVIGPDQPERDWLWRAWRLLAFREVDDRALPVPEHQVDRAAYHLLRSDESGIDGPRLVATGVLGEGRAWIARDWVEGVPLASAGVIDTATLSSAWQQLDRLHAGGLTHGAITPERLIVTPSGEVRLIGLGGGEAPASPAGRARDVAELALALAAATGPDQAADAAVEQIGCDRLAAALPFLQPLALSAHARQLTRTHRGLLESTRWAIGRVSGVTPPPAPSQLRVAARNVIPLILLFLAVNVLLPQATRAAGLAHVFAQANWAWIGVAFAGAASTYVAAATSWVAAAPVRLALGRTFAVQFAAAFTNRLTPAGIGGMTTNVAYMQRAGANRGEAVTAAAGISVAGFIVHLIGLAAIAPLLGATGGWHVSTPDLSDRWPLLIGIVVVLGVIGIAFWRRRLRHRVRALLDRIWVALRATLARPVRALIMLAAACGISLGYIAALVASVRAYGGTLPPGRIAAIYFGASAVAAVAPTPGGLGALEAALVAGLGAAGLARPPAIAAVISYRLVTYWLPVVPGVVLWRVLRRRQIL
jgi:undecaprenyl-diphosphatase